MGLQGGVEARQAPDIADNGAVVAVTVSTSLPNVSSISLFAPGNASPLVASFELGLAAVPLVSTRIRMAKSAELIAVVKQDIGPGQKCLYAREAVAGNGFHIQRVGDHAAAVIQLFAKQAGDNFF